MRSIDLPIYQRQTDVKQDRSRFFNLFKKLSLADIGLGLIGFLFGRAIILNGLMPFGFSYFSVFLYQKEKKQIKSFKFLFIILGVSFGYISQLGFLSTKYIFAILILTIAVKYLDKLKIFTYALVTCLSILICQIPSLIFADNVTDFISLLAEVLIVYFFTLLILKVLPDSLIYVERRNKIGLIGLMVSGAIIGGFISGFPIERIGNINIMRVLISYFVMLAAVIGGSSIATITGVLFGFIYSISHLGIMPVIGSYALAGLIAGNFNKLNRLIVILSFMLSNLIYIIFITDPGYIIPLMEEAVIAGCILLITPQQIISSFSLLIRDRNRGKELQDRQLQNFITERMGQFSQILDELSNSFFVVNSSETNEIENVGTFLDLITDKVCKKCELYNSCWKQSFYRTYNSLFDLLVIAENRGEVTKQDLEKIMTISCSNKIQLATAITQFVKMNELNNYWEDRLKDSENILLRQLSGMSEVIGNLANNLSVQVRSETELETKVESLLNNNGFLVQEILAANYNDEEVEFTIRKSSCNGNNECIEKLVPLLNNKLDYNLELNWNECGAELNKSNCTCQLATASKYDFEIGVATSSQKEGISGDNYTVFKQKNGKLVAVLSDGMGVGSKAATESESAITLLKRMIQSGLDYNLSLETVNSTLCLRSNKETFATVDLLSIDQITGQAEFIKIGSASSFIKRGSDISMIKSTSLPVGILNQVEIESNFLKLQANDFIIMMSDGVLDSNRNLTIKEEWVLKLLKNNLINDPQSLAQYILDKAQGNAIVEDDMTVLVIKVDE